MNGPVRLRRADCPDRPARPARSARRGGPGTPTVRGVLGDQEGYATILAASLAAALTGVIVILAAVAATLIALHRAQVAADMAAVAAATALAEGQPACPVAESTARLNDAEPSACRVDGEDVVVTVTVSGRSGVARAGPL